MAKKDSSEKVDAGGGGGSPGAGGQLVRLSVIVIVNAALAVAAIILTSTEHGKLPALDAQTLMVDLLPISAAFGLLVACRRLDFSLPALLAVAVALRLHPSLMPAEPMARLGIVCGITGGVGLVSSMVTWLGKISSALWTALLAVGLWMVAKALSAEVDPHAVGWAWPAAVGASLGLLAIGAIMLGAVKFVDLPSVPPIIGTGIRGFPGLVGVWIVAGLAMGLFAQGDGPRGLVERPLMAYPPILAAAAMSGAYILRGRWGALAAIVTASLGHLVWAFVWSAELGPTALDWILPVAAPLVAVPLFLALDAIIRAKTGEQAPTGLLS